MRLPPSPSNPSRPNFPSLTHSDFGSLRPEPWPTDVAVAAEKGLILAVKNARGCKRMQKVHVCTVTILCLTILTYTNGACASMCLYYLVSVSLTGPKALSFPFSQL